MSDMPSSGGEVRVMSFEISPGVLAWAAELAVLFAPKRVDITARGPSSQGCLCTSKYQRDHSRIVRVELFILDFRHSLIKADAPGSNMPRLLHHVEALLANKRPTLVWRREFLAGGLGADQASISAEYERCLMASTSNSTATATDLGVGLR